MLFIFVGAKRDKVWRRYLLMIWTTGEMKLVRVGWGGVVPGDIWKKQAMNNVLMRYMLIIWTMAEIKLVRVGKEKLANWAENAFSSPTLQKQKLRHRRRKINLKTILNSHWPTLQTQELELGRQTQTVSPSHYFFISDLTIRYYCETSRLV